jgi:hypothetical protein
MLKVILGIDASKARVEKPMMGQRSIRAGPLKNRRQGLEKNQKVQSQRPFVDIIQIHPHPVVKANVASAIDLPEACDARLDAEATLVPLRIDPLHIPHR